MSVDIRSSDRRQYMNELQAREKEIAAGLLKASQPASPKALQENEKRIRREIANSNERRRMQCINAGFSNLRALIPQLEGEKLSKAAILQHATEYITSMEKDKTKLQMQLDHTKRMLSELGQDRIIADAYVSSSPPPSKRKKRDTESSDEGVGSLSDGSDEGGSDLQHENVTLRHQLEDERQRCATLEERICYLENQLLAVLQVQGSHTSTLHDLRPVSIDRHHLQQLETLYNRKVIEVPTSHETLMSSSRSEDFQPPRPQSPTPERRMSVEISVPLDATIQRSGSDASHYCARNVEHSPSAVKLENIPIRESNTPSVVQLSPSAELAAVTVTTTAPTTASANDRQGSHHHDNHPRRRHRQQAQLEQQRAEEEWRRQQEQQEMVVTIPTLYRPKHNTQNLENLVEAIRQIEGDRILCGEQKFYGEKHKLYDRQSIRNSEESERETSSVSDQDELKSESSGRDSPLHHHHQIIVTSHRQTTSSVTSSPKNSIMNTNSTFSEKYPIATHLLHRPLQPSYYRPDVIVHKQ